MWVPWSCQGHDEQLATLSQLNTYVYSVLSVFILLQLITVVVANCAVNSIVATMKSLEGAALIDGTLIGFATSVIESALLLMFYKVRCRNIPVLATSAKMA